MALYEYKCDKCSEITLQYRQYSQKHAPCMCHNCGNTAKPIFSRFTALTDTNFGFTGKIDSRMGGPPIEGRRDWKKRLKEKGLIEVDKSYGQRSPTTMKERITKLGLQAM